MMGQYMGQMGRTRLMKEWSGPGFPVRLSHMSICRICALQPDEIQQEPEPEKKHPSPGVPNTLRTVAFQ